MPPQNLQCEALNTVMSLADKLAVSLPDWSFYSSFLNNVWISFQKAKRILKFSPDVKDFCCLFTPPRHMFWMEENIDKKIRQRAVSKNKAFKRYEGLKLKNFVNGGWRECARIVSYYWYVYRLWRFFTYSSVRMVNSSSTSH